MDKTYNLRMVTCTLVNVFHALICVFIAALTDYFRDILWFIYPVILSINLTLILLLTYTKKFNLKALLKGLRKRQLIGFIVFSVLFYPMAIFS
jgi:hypothetical protein